MSFYPSPRQKGYASGGRPYQQTSRQNQNRKHGRTARPPPPPPPARAGSCPCREIPPAKHPWGISREHARTFLGSSENRQSPEFHVSRHRHPRHRQSGRYFSSDQQDQKHS